MTNWKNGHGCQLNGIGSTQAKLESSRKGSNRDETNTTKSSKQKTIFVLSNHVKRDD